ncbi:hypothetical protein AAOE16_00550 [Ekhidna sp. MALMAid0563]|uniref:hypothetical protein n=1 Tax=Ekhidna sp. MALMAid0563 TaxID=3143937 RepID=UPI0032DE7CBD
MKSELNPKDYIKFFNWKDILVPFLVALFVKYLLFINVYVYRLYVGILINHLIYWGLHKRVNSYFGRFIADIILILIVIAIHLVDAPDTINNISEGFALSVLGTLSLIAITEIINTLLLYFIDHFVKKFFNKS